MVDDETDTFLYILVLGKQPVYGLLLLLLRLHIRGDDLVCRAAHQLVSQSGVQQQHSLIADKRKEARTVG